MSIDARNTGHAEAGKEENVSARGVAREVLATAPKRSLPGVMII